MSKSFFEQAMSRIARQDEQWKQAELRAEQKRALMRKIRKVCLIIVGVALVGFAYMHRVELGQKIQNLTGGSSNSSDTGAGKNLKNIQEAAQKRDAVLDDLAGK